MKLLAFAFTAALFATPAVAGDTCPINPVAALAVTTLPGGQIAVPVTIDGQSTLLVVQLTNQHTEITGDFLVKVHAPVRRLSGGEMIGDTPFLATLESFSIGDYHAQYVKALRPRSHVFAGTAGYLGSDILQNFDIEFDLGHGKMNLFTPGRCPGHEIYWADAGATLPFKLDPGGFVDIAMQLDGKPVTVTFTTDVGNGTLDVAVAKKLGFEIPDQLVLLDPRLTGGQKRWLYPFKSLSSAGYVYNDPQISLVKDVPMWGGVMPMPKWECDGYHHSAFGLWDYQCFHGPDVRLGLADLASLRTYFGFKEKVLYITAAEAHR